MEITTRLRKRFCKDCGIPINIFHEPYFSDRLDLFDKFYNSIEKWTIFCEELQHRYKNEEEYFAEYNKVKDDAINFIKNSEGYQRFNEMNMNNFKIDTHGISGKDIYHPSNDGKKFISIDMEKANFSALKYFSEDIFDNKKSWYGFLLKFTNNEHILQSKYIRQVILGNCNPKRQITYEKYLMSLVLKDLLFIGVDLNDVVFFSNDEIVFTLTEKYLKNPKICNYKSKWDFPLTFKCFLLKKVNGAEGYLKFFSDINVDFKCVSHHTLPFIIRYLLYQDINEYDKVFYHEGLLAKFIEVPEISI